MSQPGAPVDAADAHLAERPVSSEQVFKGRLLDVRRDVVALPDGSHATREYFVHPGAVCVVPLTDQGQLVLVRQYRYPLGRVMLEFPAGKLDAGESVQACAQRELLEETGYTATQWARAGITHNACAYATEAIEIWFARGLQAGTAQPDEGEFVETLCLDPAELDASVQRGELTDAKTQVGLLWLQRWQAGAWPLAWVAAV